MTLPRAVLAAPEPGPWPLELFTSQGCSSCPAADAVLAGLVGRADLLPLALHVTYWDRLGWRDSLGDPRFTERQRWYARLLRGQGLYTPQLVVAGEIDLVGTDSRLERLLSALAARPHPALITIGTHGEVALPALPLSLYCSMRSGVVPSEVPVAASMQRKVVLSGPLLAAP